MVNWFYITANLRPGGESQKNNLLQLWRNCWQRKWLWTDFNGQELLGMKTPGSAQGDIYRLKRLTEMGLVPIHKSWKGWHGSVSLHLPINCCCLRSASKVKGSWNTWMYYPFSKWLKLFTCRIGTPLMVFMLKVNLLTCFCCGWGGRGEGYGGIFSLFLGTSLLWGYGMFTLYPVLLCKTKLLWPSG
jgi:hypothetical protein